MSDFINRYRGLCQKNDEENYFFDRYFFRRFSIYFTVLFIKLGVKANQATFLSLVASLLACYFLVFNTPVMMLGAVLCIFAYNTLDHVDGELARYYIGRGLQRPSLKGQFFDVLVHKFSTNLFLFFMGVSVYYLYGYYFAVLLGFVACVGMSAFPNLLASQVVLQKVGGDGGAVYERPVTDVLYLLEKKQEQVRKLRSGGFKQKVKKIVTELLFFPGCLVLIMLVVLADVVVAGSGGGFSFLGYELNFRLIFLVFITPVYLLNGLRQTRKWSRKFEGIS